MNAIVRAQPLNNAFKRFQRLPELPIIEVSDQRGTPSYMQAQPPSPKPEPSRDAEEARTASALIG